eukprot:scaffold12002_cov115-Isochrysis_galbana.AAC.5
MPSAPSSPSSSPSELSSLDLGGSGACAYRAHWRESRENSPAGGVGLDGWPAAHHIREGGVAHQDPVGLRPMRCVLFLRGDRAAGARRSHRWLGRGRRAARHSHVQWCEPAHARRDLPAEREQWPSCLHVPAAGEKGECGMQWSALTCLRQGGGARAASGRAGLSAGSHLGMHDAEQPRDLGWAVVLSLDVELVQQHLSPHRIKQLLNLICVHHLGGKQSVEHLAEQPERLVAGRAPAPLVLHCHPECRPLCEDHVHRPGQDGHRVRHTTEAAPGDAMVLHVNLF